MEKEKQPKETDAIREKLERYAAFQRKIDNQIERLENLAATMGSPSTPNLTGLPSGGGDGTSKIERQVIESSRPSYQHRLTRRHSKAAEEIHSPSHDHKGQPRSHEAGHVHCLREWWEHSPVPKDRRGPYPDQSRARAVCSTDDKRLSQGHDRGTDQHQSGEALRALHSASHEVSQAQSSTLRATKREANEQSKRKQTNKAKAMRNRERKENEPRDGQREEARPCRRQKRNLQNTATIAKLFGVTTRQIQKLAKAGTIPASATDPYQFDLLPTIQAYIRWLQERVDTRQTKSEAALAAEGRKMAADADLKGTKAKLAALQLRELDAKMHRAEDVAAMTDDLMLVIREKIEELPCLLAEPVTQTTNAAEASAVIQTECWRVLDDLAAYKYDPEAYEQRRRNQEL